jgi:photosystem II stability/assembly factor-like uncharacterized protein
MKRLAVRLFIAIVTFAVGAIATWLFYQRKPSPPPRQVLPGSTWATPTSANPKLPKVSDAPATIEEDGQVTLQFVTENVGWLTIGGKLWRTRDGGSHWVPVRLSDIDTDREESIQHIQFIDEQRGWATADQGLYRTTNGGESWELLKRSTGLDTDGVRILTGFAFLGDGRTGWIIENRYRQLIGDEVPGIPHTEYSSDGNQVLSSFIYHTEDGGLSWTQQTIKPTWNTLDGITAIEPRGAMAFGIAGIYFLKGNQWLPSKARGNSGSDCLATGCGSGCDLATTISFVDERSGWIANTDGAVGTFDGGRTWTDISNDLWQGYSDHMYDVQVQFYDENLGWGLNGNGHLLSTRDGGETWQILENSQEFNRIFLLGKKYGWAVSNDGVFRIPMESEGKLGHQ